MFKDTKAFSSFSVNDLAAAKTFYTQVLGLEVKEGQMGTLELNINGQNPMMVYLKDNHQPATHTVLNFPVENIEQAVDKLNSQGVSFEQYDFMNTNEKGISEMEDGPKMAWFKDPAGNIFSLIQSH